MDQQFRDKRTVSLSMLTGHNPTDRFVFEGKLMTVIQAINSINCNTDVGKRLVDELTRDIFKDGVDPQV